MSDPIEILIIGFGAVGTIYGWILSQNKNVRVTAIARSAFESMSKEGIDIESEKFGNIPHWRPYRLVRDTNEANDRAYAFIICCFKVLPDLLPSASVVAPFLDGPFGRQDDDPETSGPCVVLIQNGIGIEHPIQVAYPLTPIISVVAWIGANLLPGPKVTHGLLEKLMFGLYMGEGPNSLALHPDDLDETDDPFADPAGYRGPNGKLRLDEGWKRTRLLETLLKNGGGGVEVVDDIQATRWAKNLWNAAWSSICTLSRSTVSAVCDPSVLPYTLPVVRRTMLEVLYVARAWGYSEQALPMQAIDDTIKMTIQNYQIRTGAQTPAVDNNISPDGFLDLAPTKTSAFMPSMTLDCINARPMELEPIIGSLLDRARAKGVDTPRLDLVYASLKVYQDAAVKRSAESASHQDHIKAWLKRRSAVGGIASVQIPTGLKVKGKPVLVENDE